MVQGWGWSWIALSLALALHVWDEAAHDFLSVYNPTVRAIREQVPFLPLPTFSFGIWLTGLILAVLVLLLLSGFAFQGARWLKPISYALAVLIIGNGMLHLLASAYKREMVPGVYSSPVLIGAAIWLIVELRKSGKRAGDVRGV